MATKPGPQDQPRPPADQDPRVSYVPRADAGPSAGGPGAPIDLGADVHLIDTAMSEVEDLNGGALADDVAVLLLSRPPSSVPSTVLPTP